MRLQLHTHWVCASTCTPTGKQSVHRTDADVQHVSHLLGGVAIFPPGEASGLMSQQNVKSGHQVFKPPVDCPFSCIYAVTVEFC